MKQILIAFMLLIGVNFAASAQTSTPVKEPTKTEASKPAKKTKHKKTHKNKTHKKEMAVTSSPAPTKAK